MVKDFVKKYWYSFIIFAIIAFGIFLRLKGFISNPSLWHDEAALAYSIKFKEFSGFLGHLRFSQVAPPLFMILTKFLVNLLNASNNVNLFDFATKIIPFSCGVLSIFVFYQLCKNIFSAKKTTIMALLLFAINIVLVHYSFEFKQYCGDMLCVLLVILFFIKLDLSKLSYKKLVLYSIGFAPLIWFSFTTAFFFGAGCVTLIFKRKDFKKIILLFLPLFISLLLYFKFYILGTYSSDSNVMLGFWANQFVLPNLSNFLSLLVANIKYFFFPAKSVLYFLILMVCGIVLCFKDKKYNFINIFLISFVFLIIASIFHFYPFSNRVILFLIPLFILLIVKPMDRVNVSHKIKSFFILLMLTFFLIPQVLSTYQYLKVKTVNKGDFAREMMGIMVENLKPTDKIFVNKASNIEFEYYSSFYNIKNAVIHERITDKPDKRYLEFLNSLPKGYYWFYLPYDSSHLKVIGYLKDWTKNHTRILYKNEATQSVLMYVYID